MKLLNRARKWDAISGINGVNPNGSFLVTMSPGYRYHDLKFMTLAVYYSGSAAVSPIIIKSAAGVVGTGTVKPTIVNGVVTAVTMVAGTSNGFAVGDTITFPDPTGVGCVLTCNNAIGTLTTAYWTVTSGGTASPCPPNFLIPGQLFINASGSTSMWDISVFDILAIRAASGFPDQYGQLSVDFTEPRNKWRANNELTAWDLVNTGDGSKLVPKNFTVSGVINPLASSPSLVGNFCYDFSPNHHYSKTLKKWVRVQMPVVKHAYTKQLVSGENVFTDLPHKSPLRRMWIRGSQPGNIYQLYVLPDGEKAFYATQQAVASRLADDGFTFAQPVNSGVAAPTNLTNNGPVLSNAYDIAYITDPDGNLGRSVNTDSGLEVHIFSEVQQTSTIVMETLPGGYTG